MSQNTFNPSPEERDDSAFRRPRGLTPEQSADHASQRDGFTPLINRNVQPSHPTFESDKTGVKPRETTVLFEIDGVEYSIENRQRPNLSYGYLRRIREEGAQAATAWLMEKILTKEALLALEEYEDMTTEEDAALQKALERIALGGSGPKG